MKINYKGKDLENCTKEELIEAIEIIVRRDNIVAVTQEDEYRIEVARLKNILNGVTSAIGKA